MGHGGAGIVGPADFVGTLSQVGTRGRVRGRETGRTPAPVPRGSSLQHGHHSRLPSPIPVPEHCEAECDATNARVGANATALSRHGG